MGRLFLVGRLAHRDLTRRWAESLLLLVAITSASATLTLGLILHGVTNQPFQQTLAATRGPDDVASSATDAQNATSAADLAALVALKTAKGVSASSGPFPLTTVLFGAHDNTVGANVEGRDEAPAKVDQPAVTDGSWIRPGGIVLERSFADALGVHVGDPVTLNGRSFPIVGIAVTAAFTPYPTLGCRAGCLLGHVPLDSTDTGLVWATQSLARSLATADAPLTYYLNLKLTNPAQGDAFANNYSDSGPVFSAPNSQFPTTPSVMSWEQTARIDGNLVRNEQTVMLVGSWLLALLALASLAVLVGGRMADQIQRVGLLKAIGGTPSLVSSVLLAEYLLLALGGALLGLLAGRLFAPVLTNPGNGLLGSAPAPPLGLETVLVVVAVAFAVAGVAALVPALRAARMSTVTALADSARTPRRRPLLVAVSTRLPVTLLISIRVMARRLRRTLLSVFSVFVTVSGLVAVIAAHEHLNDTRFAGTAGLVNPRIQSADQVLLMLSLMLVALAAVNAVFITRAIVVDARHSSALMRALGATPRQVTVGLAAAQTLPAALGALLGIPGGIELYDAVRHGTNAASFPSLMPVITVVLGSMLAVALLTALPARYGIRKPVAGILQSELA